MRRRAKLYVAMTIAGSDPSGGAGIQADLQTFAALSVHGLSVLTAVIAQNSRRVASIALVDPQMVTAQIATVVAERRPDALKVGALGSAPIVRAVADAIDRFDLPAPVVDPVLVSSSGVRLLDREGERALRGELIPLARVITPNIPEAEALSGVAIDCAAAMRPAARALRRIGARAVVIKGGHRFSGNGGIADSRVIDLLFDGRKFVELSSPRVAGGGAHGTGCAFSSAIAAMLARGAELEAAVRAAQAFMIRALRRSFVLSAGGRPLPDHREGR